MKNVASINGLRGIAILLVLLFHFFPAKFVGGFVGVDIFFVISGYLITGKLLQDCETSNTPFQSFYVSRIRRLLPAICVVAVSVVVLGWMLLLPDEFKALGEHLIAAGTFSSNFILISESGYFDGPSEYKPLLHFWSLAVEVQFYLFYPLLFRYLNRQSMRYKMFGAIGIVSFGLNIWLYKTDQAVLDFFLPFTRLWEFFAGAWLMLCHFDAKEGIFHRLLNRRWLFWLALISLSLVVMKYDGKRHYPGTRAVVPVLFAMLVIAGTSLPRRFGHGMASPALRWVSDVSYPWYLWHWPLLSMATIVTAGQLPVSGKVGILLISLLLAGLTFRFVEQSCRNYLQDRRAFLVLAFCLSAIVGSGWLIISQNGFPSRISQGNVAPIQKNYAHDALYRSATRLGNESCQLSGEVDKGLVCIKTGSQPGLMMVGDSHAMALNSAIVDGQFHAESVLLGAHGCVPVAVPNRPQQSSACHSLFSEVVRYLDDHSQIRQVWLVNYYRLYAGFDAEQATVYRQKMREFINGLRLRGLSVSIVLDVPRLPVSPKRCFDRTGMIDREKAYLNCDQPVAEVHKEQARYRAIMQQVAQDNPGVRLIDLVPFFCDRNRCKGASPVQIYYFDEDHLSISGSRKVLAELMADK